MSLTKLQVADWIRSSNGITFAVKFQKRGKKELRTMYATTQKPTALKGGEKSYESEDVNLLTVFDLEKNDWRAIPIEGVIAYDFKGHWNDKAHCWVPGKWVNVKK